MIKFITEKIIICTECTGKIPEHRIAYRHDSDDGDKICEDCYDLYINETI